MICTPVPAGATKGCNRKWFRPGSGQLVPIFLVPRTTPASPAGPGMHALLPSLQASIFVLVKPSPFFMVLESQITPIANFDESVEAYHMAQSDVLDCLMLH